MWSQKFHVAVILAAERPVDPFHTRLRPTAGRRTRWDWLCRVPEPWVDGCRRPLGTGVLNRLENRLHTLATDPSRQTYSTRSRTIHRR